MNLDVTSVAVPNAASLRTPKYSSTAQPTAPGASPAAPSTQCGRGCRPVSSWHRRQIGPDLIFVDGFRSEAGGAARERISRHEATAEDYSGEDHKAHQCRRITLPVSSL